MHVIASETHRLHDALEVHNGEMVRSAESPIVSGDGDAAAQAMGDHLLSVIDTLSDWPEGDWPEGD